MAGGNLGNAVQAKLKGNVVSLPANASTTDAEGHIYRGALVGVQTTTSGNYTKGYACPMDDVTLRKFMGVAEEECNLTGAGDSNGDKNIKVRRKGIFKMTLESTAAAGSLVGAQVYMAVKHTAAIDQLVDIAGNCTNDAIIGIITKHGTDAELASSSNSTEIWVDITPAAWESMVLTTHIALVDSTAHKISGVAGEAARIASGAIAIANIRKRTVLLTGDGAVAYVLGTPAAGDDGLEVRLVHEGTVGVATISTAGAETIDGGATYTALDLATDSVTLAWDNTETNWVIVSEKLHRHIETGASAAVTLNEMRSGIVFCSNAGVCAVTLATPAAGDAGLRCTFVKTGTAGVMSFVTTGAELIDGRSNFFHLGNKWDSVELIWDGTGWVVGYIKEKLGGSYIFFEDFINHIWLEGDWQQYEVNTGSESTSDILGGALSIITDTADDDASQVGHTIECFDFATDKPFHFKCRFKYSDGTGAASAIDIMVGLIETEDLKAEASNIPAEGAVFHIDDGDMNVDFSTAVGGSDTDHNAESTLAEDIYMEVEMIWDGTNITSFINGVEGNLNAAGECPSAATLLTPTFLVRSGEAGGHAKSLIVDYIYCKQLR